MSTNVAKKNTMKYIHAAIMIMLMLCGGFLPAFGQITPLGMKVFGVFLGLLYGWIFVGILWPSVLGFFTLSLTGVTSPLMAFVSGFTNPTVTMVIMSYVFAYCLGQIGVNEAIAYWAMSKKVFVNRPWLFATALVLVTCLMGMLGGSFAAIFLMWGVTKTIAEKNGMEKGNLLVSMTYALILFGGFSGGQMVPFFGGVIMYGGFLTAATGVVVEGLQFLVIGELYTILSMVLVILIIKFVFKPDASKFCLSEEMRAEYATYKLNSKQKVGLGLLVVYFLALLLPSVFHGAFWTMLSTWGMVGMTILYLVIFSIWKDENGNDMCSMDECFQKGVAWGPILLFMVTIPLANAMESEEVGIMATVNEFCTPIFSSMGTTAMLIAVVIIIGILTQFLHNVVMAALFTPVLAPIFISMGGNPITFFFVLYAALCCSFGTPAASMQAGLLFGHEDVPTKHGYILGWAYYLATVVIVIAMIPLCDILFAGLV